MIAGSATSVLMFVYLKLTIYLRNLEIFKGPFLVKHSPSNVGYALLAFGVARQWIVLLLMPVPHAIVCIVVVTELHQLCMCILGYAQDMKIIVARSRTNLHLHFWCSCF